MFEIAHAEVEISANVRDYWISRNVTFLKKSYIRFEDDDGYVYLCDT